MRRAIHPLLVGVLLLFGSTQLSTQAPPGRCDRETKQASADQKPDADTKPGAGEQKAEPPKEKPFADIIKGAEVIKGLFTLYKTEDKVLLEIQPEQFDKMYMLSLTRESGLGEARFYADSDCGETPIVFHKERKNVRVMLKNTRFAASPMGRAVAHSFSDSILGSTKRESRPHPERKSELIDLGAILLTDVPMMAYQLNDVFRIGYQYDAKNSDFGMLKAFDRDNIEMATVNHYAAEQPPLSPLLPPGVPRPPTPEPPHNVPDIRSTAVSFPLQHFRTARAGVRSAFGRRPRGTLLHASGRLQRRQEFRVQPPVHQPLEAGEAGSLRVALAAETAHRVLDGKHHTGGKPRCHPRRRLIAEQSVRAHRV